MKSAGAAVVTEGSTPERRPSGELAHGASSSINTVSVVMADVAAMHGRIQELEYENIRLKASQTYADQLAEVERQRAKLWEQVNELRLRNENLETENSTLRDKVTSLQEANADLQDRLTTLEAEFEALKHAVEDDQSAIALMQLTTCFQSKAARFLLPPKFAGLKASGKSKAALAQYWKVGQLRDAASQIDGAKKTELTQQLFDATLIPDNDFNKILELQPLFDSLAAGRHAVAHPKLSDTELMAFCDGDAELEGLARVCQWLNSRVGDGSIMGIPA